ncbi:hypothetical protein GCM10027589_24340 [Actinocorallia lasiicapitis]
MRVEPTGWGETVKEVVVILVPSGVWKVRTGRERVWREVREPYSVVDRAVTRASAGEAWRVKRTARTARVAPQRVMAVPRRREDAGRQANQSMKPPETVGTSVKGRGR